MTKISEIREKQRNTLAVILAAAENYAQAEDKAQGAFARAFLPMKEAGIEPATLQGKQGAAFSKQSPERQAFVKGLYAAWMSPEFAEKMADDTIKSGVQIEGRQRDRTTGAFRKETKSKKDWATSLSRRVGAALAFYQDLFAEKVDVTGRAIGAGAGGKGKGKTGSQAGKSRASMPDAMLKQLAAWSTRLDKIANGTADKGTADAFAGDVSEVRSAVKALIKAISDAK